MAETEIALDSGALNELNSPEARALLDTIDSLRELQVGEIVNLPQIIVVGDQSSGKSSVLEAISRVRFPTKGDVCTRFATELVLRRAPETRIRVKIDPTEAGSAQHFQRTSFDKDALPNIIDEATHKMGIQPGSAKGFSKDVLRVEICGPDVYPVTLVDLPGFFHSETSDQSGGDKTIVQQLAERYMQQKNSIILTVVSASNNLANQIVVDEAKKHDPRRERTLGVITKPDLAAPGSQDEKKCLQLVKGKESIHKLQLGWHVLRNRSEGKEAASVDERDADEERFFQTGAWSTISPTSRGIAPLRKKLSKVLLEHIQATLPGLITEIEYSLAIRQHRLEQLGKSRSEVEEMRTYLLEIAEQFQRLARDGVSGHYSDKFFGDLYDENDDKKLRAVLRNLNRAFYATLIIKGIDREIWWDDVQTAPIDSGGIDWLQQGTKAPQYLEPFLSLFAKFPKPRVVSEALLRHELEILGAVNQGTEFPALPNGQLGYQLFKRQAKPWHSIAKFYLTQATEFAKSFVEKLLVHIIGGDKQTANAILLNYVDTFFDHRQMLLDEKLQEIIRPYQQAYGPPLDSEFHAAFSSRTIRRDAGRVAALLEKRFPLAFEGKGPGDISREKIESVISSSEKEKMSEFGTDKIIDMTMTHYQMSLRTFAENTVNLVVENCLVSHISTILTPLMIMQMNEDHLRELASESEEVQAERKMLKHEVESLREGLKKCQKARLHERTVLPRLFSISSVPVSARPSSSTSASSKLNPPANNVPSSFTGQSSLAWLSPTNAAPWAPSLQTSNKASESVFSNYSKGTPRVEFGNSTPKFTFGPLSTPEHKADKKVDANDAR